MQKKQVSHGALLKKPHAMSALVERVASAVFWLLTASLWSLGATVWLYRIIASAAHGHFLAAGLWLLIGLLFTHIYIPTRGLDTLYGWAVSSAIITFTPWGLKIAFAFIYLAMIGLGLMVAWSILQAMCEWFRWPTRKTEALISRPSREDLKEAQGSLFHIFLGVWIGMSLLVLGLCGADLASILHGSAWRDAWTARGDAITFDSIVCIFAASSAAWCKWRVAH